MNYPNVIAAATKRRQHQDDADGKDLWDLGEALIKDCGEPSDEHEGHYDKIERATAELEKRGFNYTLNNLVKIREVAFIFPNPRRRRLGFWLHEEAGNPDMLDAVVKQAKADDENVTALYIRGIVSAWRSKQDAERKDKNQAAKTRKLKAKEKKLAAKTEESKAKAQAEIDAANEEIEETKSAPARREAAPPDEDEMPLVLNELELMRSAREAKRLANEAKRLIGNRAHELSPQAIAVLTEISLEAANLWTDVANTVRKATLNKRGHLAVVGA